MHERIHRAQRGATATRTGAILAGGLSTRMGRDKATLRLADGRLMIEHVMDAVADLCQRVVVVGCEFPGQDQGYGCIADLRPQCGPLGGIETLLASGMDVRGQYLVCPCDVPLITADLLRRLAQPSEALATVFHVEGKPPHELEPLPARIDAEALPMVQRLLDGGGRSVWRLMEQLKPMVVAITAEDARQLHNVNTLDDLRLATDQR